MGSLRIRTIQTRARAVKSDNNVLCNVLQINIYQNEYLRVHQIYAQTIRTTFAAYSTCTKSVQCPAQRCAVNQMELNITEQLQLLLLIEKTSSVAEGSDREGRGQRIQNSVATLPCRTYSVQETAKLHTLSKIIKDSFSLQHCESNKA